MSMASHDQKSHVACNFDYLDLRNAMMPLVTQSASLYADASANGSCDQKCHVAPHFNCLDIGNVIITLTMQSASCDANSGASGVK